MIVNASVIIGALVVVAVSGLVVEHLRVDVLTRTIEPALLVNRQIIRAMTDAQSVIRDHAANPQPSDMSDFQAAESQITTGLATLTPLAQRADLEPTAERQRMAVQRWLREVAGPSLAEPPRPPQAVVAEADFADVREANIDLNAELVQRSSRLARETLWVSALVVSLVVAAGVFGLLLILNRGRKAQAEISPPLEELQRVVTSQAEGDLDIRADPDAGVVEVRAVARAVNHLLGASALEKRRLADDAQLATAIHRIGMSITHTLDLSEIMNTAAVRLRKELHADVAWVRTFEGENDRPGRILGAMQPHAAVPASPPELQETVVAAAPMLWSEQRAAVLTLAEPSSAGVLGAADGRAILEFVGTHADVTSLLLVALGSGTQCLGYFALGRRDDQTPWTLAEAQAAIDVGHYIGRAVLHERMFDSERLLVEQLQALDFQKDEFVSTVSHELRTPLAAIIGHLELIDEEEVSGPARRSLRTVERNAHRLRMLIEDLLLLSRVESRDALPPLVPVDLDVIARYVMSDQPPVATDVSTRYQGSPGVLVRGDEDELGRMVINLIGNAVKFSSPGSEVVVSVERNADSAILRVVDRGIGIAPADQPHVFTRFYRSRRLEANSVPGTGLGLAITKIIVDKHNGTIDLDSELGLGTTVTVTLPLAESGTSRRPPRSAQFAG